MSITPYAPGSLATVAAGTGFVSLRAELDEASRQLSSGLKAQSYGGLGVERRTSLDARGKIAAIGGYDAAIGNATLRLGVMTRALDDLSKSAGEVKTSLAIGSFDLGLDGRTSAQTGAAQKLQLAIDILNSDVGGQHLFAGRATDRPPLANAAAILDGDPATGAAGLRQLMAERSAADLGSGTPKLGRLDLGYTAGATGLTLSENTSPESRANFGFILQGATSSNPSAMSLSVTAAAPAAVTLGFASQPKDGDVVRVTLNRADGSQETRDLTARASPAPGSSSEFAIGASPAATAANAQALLAGQPIAGAQSGGPPGVTATFSGGTPARLNLDVTGQPSHGDVIRVSLGLRDGSRETVELTARANPDPASLTDFAIGATPAETAANIAAKLGGAIDRKANTTLAAVSAELAAGDFFVGSSSPGREPRRVAGPPFDAATGFSNVTTGKTAIWYAGDDSSFSARSSAVAQIDKGEVVGIGAQANEPAIRSVLAQFAVLASTTFTASAADQGRYQALVDRVGAALTPTENGPTLDRIGAELSQASAAMGAAKDRHGRTKAALQSAIDGVENASPEEVATRILSLQTRLQASYQTTSLLAKLSMVNYL